MTFEDVIKEGGSIIAEYKANPTVDKAKVQSYRDQLSALCVTLSIYKSDFYDTYVGAELKRKIFEAREKDRNIDNKIGVPLSEVKAKIASESLCEAEIDADRKYQRAKSVLEAWNQVLNSFASRMHENK